MKHLLTNIHLASFRLRVVKIIWPCSFRGRKSLSAGAVLLDEQSRRDIFIVKLVCVRYFLERTSFLVPLPR